MRIIVYGVSIRDEKGEETFTGEYPDDQSARAAARRERSKGARVAYLMRRVRGAEGLRGAPRWTTYEIFGGSA